MTTRPTTTIAVLLAACGTKPGKTVPPPPPPDVAEARQPEPPPETPPEPEAPPEPEPPPVDPYVVSAEGVGPIVDFRVIDSDDEASMDALRELLRGTGLTVSFQVVDLGTNDEMEEGYYSISDGEEELAQVMRDEPFVTVHADSTRYHTTDGVHVGDPLSALAAARPALACLVTGRTGFLSCQNRPDEKGVVFVLDASCRKGRPPKKDTLVPVAKLGTCKIIAMVR